MIIGISGYAGSGKDEVGKIIQKLTTPESSTRSFFQIKKFAGKLKQVASLLTGIDVLRFEDQEFKKTYLGPEWKYIPSLIFADVEAPIQMSVRDFLRKLGTEAVRDYLHPNTWVNALFADYKEDSFWIVTDARFPNEAKVIKSKGGYMIRVNRFKEHDNHPSETSLDNWEFDYIIDNTGTLKDLEDRVWRILNLIIIDEKLKAIKSLSFEKAVGIRGIEKCIERFEINLKNDEN